ncbi:prolipoprotein diacylglyceryl transferase [Campylobacter lari]|uniref:prolipoprotein diacylglyceryl transferase n=1 Tax=Campylobacter lari TaxID=201 RepID=UPI0021527342|nr:prolipoprotein diacylglyceryl transferase [Campylobacter lari]EGH4467924.1 prolipoprotein diacylglyceryl transferase [Campylobacter lari]MCR6526418.1 prolipoprotein diacylglyceryl transferase [Campylobacter lari]MCR6549527.1 prolipoprotein diacylglyceryl transferase [Campylobacter lari]MCV3426363.1 prolipoprotein diacylglyceryl transferase [Campylobacter lari]
MEFWQNIYANFDVVAFEIFGLKVHWYGIMYVLALLVALMVAKYYAIKDNMGISKAMLDSYFIWVEIGVILGARLGYILIYDAHTLWYLTHPWQIFNPFYNGEFVGIRGMSYHGAVVGFLIATYAFCKKNKQNLWKYLDLVAISVPCGYIFGRIGNFLNQELFGRATEVPWGIYVDGILRHPSQLYEAFLEGCVVFAILLLIKKYKKYNGELIAYYTILYALARFVCEFFREPDFGIGFVAFGMSMGQILSLLMFLLGLFLSFYLRNIKKNL